MDDSDDERRYSFRSKPAIRNPHPHSMSGHYTNTVGYAQQDDFDEEEENPQFNNSQNEFYYQSYYEEEAKRNKKKRKMEPLSPNYELVHRSVLNPNLGGSSRDSWNEEGSFVLLEVWGERYLELGRRSLRGEDWVEVAEKVSEMTGVERTEMECRNQLDVLKKKYKKERAKMEKVGGGFVSKWVFFKKMDVLLNLRMRGHCGLGCGVDSGEYVFMNPRIYLDKSNVLDEMRDSPGVSDEEGDVEDELERGEDELDGKSAKLLADSIHRFGEIYEKIESSKRKQMMELEELRKDFQKEIELQKKEIVERAQAEIAKLREEKEEEEEDDDDDDEDEEEDEDMDEDDDNDNNADEEDGPNEDIHG